MRERERFFLLINYLLTNLVKNKIGTFLTCQMNLNTLDMHVRKVQILFFYFF